MNTSYFFKSLVQPHISAKLNKIQLSDDQSFAGTIILLLGGQDMSVFRKKNQTEE